MKKTYIKITTLICALITAVMLMGATIFTYAHVNQINTKYTEYIFRTLQSPVTDFNASDMNARVFLISHMSHKFGPCMVFPDIGYYGKLYWKWNSAAEGNTIESTDFKFVDVILKEEGTGKPLERQFVDYAVYYEAADAGYSFFSSKDLTGDAFLTSGTAFEVDLGEPKSNPKAEKLNAEAKAHFAEVEKLNNEELEKVDGTGFSADPYQVRTGLFTSRVAFFSGSFINNGKIGVDESDVYVFHPMAIVYANYSYVYFLFLAVLIVLLFLTVITMRRMYLSRMSYEARTKNLTRSFAHELKMPLAVTKTYVENWDIIDEKERPEITLKINNEIDHMAKMVNTLLDLSKMDKGEVKLNLEEVELYELSKVCFRHAEELAKSRNISVDIKKDKEDGEYVVSADLDMMRMVISNFLSNAIKYGKSKAGILLVSGGSTVTFKITNDGEPISKKDQKKIWDLFYKKDSSGSDRLNSNGVGLAVNKSILELHKAKFGLESSAAGTTFWFEMKKATE